ncbi:hypothetical protein EKI60_04715 [Candidatus Saccharibacteria bacterium]|nr:MAG: hypothetical protein EKI60_04715 [Candidatus Saccharibacteria bacterium]
MLKPSTAKRKGVETENFFVEYIKEKWGVVGAERRRLSGVEDRGDIAGWFKVKDGKKVKDVAVEIKSGAKLAIPTWMAELEVETLNAGADLGFIAVRPKGKPNVAEWYAMMEMDDFMALLREAGYVD